MRDHRTGYLWLVKGAGRGRFGGNTLLSKSFRGFSRVTVVSDVTGDRRPDIVALHRNGYLYLDRATRKGRLGKLLATQPRRLVVHRPARGRDRPDR